jgi:hypothetical protein
MNSRRHARLRKIQVERKCERVMRGLIEFIYEQNRPMIEAARTDVFIYGKVGRWTLSDDHVLTYEQIMPGNK